MNVSVQLHTPAPLPQGKNPITLIPTEYRVIEKDGRDLKPL